MIAGSDRGEDRSCIIGLDSPDDVAVVWAAKAKPPVSPYAPAALLCNARVERKFVMGRMNWSRIATRDRMRRQGVEDVKGGTPIVAPLVNKQPRRRKLSEGELRQQTAAAFLAWRAGQTSKNK